MSVDVDRIDCAIDFGDQLDPARVAATERFVGNQAARIRVRSGASGSADSTRSRQ